MAEVEEKLRSRRIGGRYGVTIRDVEWVRGLLLTQSKLIEIAPQDVIATTVILKTPTSWRAPAWAKRTAW